MARLNAMQREAREVCAERAAAERQLYGLQSTFSSQEQQLRNAASKVEYLTTQVNFYFYSHKTFWSIPLLSEIVRIFHFTPMNFFLLSISNRNFSFSVVFVTKMLILEWCWKLLNADRKFIIAFVALRVRLRAVYLTVQHSSWNTVICSWSKQLFTL